MHSGTKHKQSSRDQASKRMKEWWASPAGQQRKAAYSLAQFLSDRGLVQSLLLHISQGADGEDLTRVIDVNQPIEGAGSR